MDVSAALESFKAKFKPTEVAKDIPVSLDAGNLAVFDVNPLDTERLKNARDEYLAALTRDNVQLLFNEIFALPTTPVDIGVLANLPRPTTILPREKPAPKERPLTRWEKFAKAKGILKTKKSRMVYDENTDEYKPRWGYKSGANEAANQWLIEVPDRPGQDPTEDMFAKKSEEKRERIEANKKRQRRNEEAAAKQIGTKITPGMAARNARKMQIENSLKISKKSSASLGKFDKAVQNEPKTKRHEKRQFEPAVIDLKQEKDKNLGLINRMLGIN